MKGISCVILTVISISVVALAQDNCTAVFRDPRTWRYYKYDLSSLWHPPGYPDDLIYRDPSGDTFYVNFCGTTTTPCTIGSSVCQRASNYRYYSYGALHTQTFMPTDLPGQTIDTGIKILYSDGDQCTGGDIRQTTIYISCSKYASPGYFYEGTDSGCNYTLKMWSVAGCATMA